MEDGSHHDSQGGETVVAVEVDEVNGLLTVGNRLSCTVLTKLMPVWCCFRSCVIVKCDPTRMPVRDRFNGFTMSSLPSM